MLRLLPHRHRDVLIRRYGLNESRAQSHAARSASGWAWGRSEVARSSAKRFTGCARWQPRHPAPVQGAAVTTVGLGLPRQPEQSERDLQLG